MKKANKTFGGPSYFARKIKYLSAKFGIDLGDKKNYLHSNPITEETERNAEGDMLIKEHELRDAIGRGL